MPDAVATGHQNVAGVQLGNEVIGYRRIIFSTQATHENVGLRVIIGLLLGNLPPVNQSLNIGVIDGSLDQLVAAIVINPRVTGMRPVAVPPGIDQKRCDGAVRFFFC